MNYFTNGAPYLTAAVVLVSVSAGSVIQWDTASAADKLYMGTLFISWTLWYVMVIVYSSSWSGLYIAAVIYISIFIFGRYAGTEVWKPASCRWRKMEFSVKFMVWIIIATVIYILILGRYAGTEVWKLASCWWRKVEFSVKFMVWIIIAAAIYILLFGRYAGTEVWNQQAAGGGRRNPQHLHLAAVGQRRRHTEQRAGLRGGRPASLWLTPERGQDLEKGSQVCIGRRAEETYQVWRKKVLAKGIIVVIYACLDQKIMLFECHERGCFCVYFWMCLWLARVNLKYVMHVIYGIYGTVQASVVCQQCYQLSLSYIILPLLLLLIIIMKNFNRRSSHCHHGSKRRERDHT